jgi:uncharacterized protein (TIRG00374 family)
MKQIVRSFIKRWKLALNIITGIALIITIYAVRKDLLSTYQNLFHVHAWVLLLIIPLELINYHAQAKLYQHLFKIVGNKLSYKYLYLAAIELNFVNHVFPSGGAAGISYFGIKIKNNDISGGKATLIQIMKLALTLFSFEMLILVSVIFLAMGGRVNNFTMLAAGALSTLLVAGTGLFVYIIGSKARINSFFGFATIKLNQLARIFRTSNRDLINIPNAHRVFDDFHDSFQEIRKRKKQIRAPLLYALLANVTEIAVIYSVFIAFDRFVNVGAVILAYGVANFAGLVSVLPGGVGIYEALMIAVFLTTGVPPQLSLPVIIMYRVLNTVLQIPPGYYLYQRNINRRKTQVIV